MLNLKQAIGQGPDVLGGKGYGLALMAEVGLPVPPATILPVNYWRDYDFNKDKGTDRAADAIVETIHQLTAEFGYMPLVSVRSGAPVSAPGMMDTMLNVGITADNYAQWVKRLGVVTAETCLRRFANSYIKLVMLKKFEVPAKCPNIFQWFEKRAKQSWPTVETQLIGATLAVFASWDSDRAQTYRKLHGIDRNIGTAVVIQTMVFGNLNNKSCTGVLFTRNPDDGDNLIMGEYLVRAQGEDVVSGSHTPMSWMGMLNWNQPVFNELLKTAKGLESLRGYPQDIEFTVENGKLWILQTRNIKRTARAAVKIALDMIDEGGDPLKCLKTVTVKDYAALQQPTLQPGYDVEPAFTGLPACAGVVIGKVVNSSSKADGDSILVTEETNPCDIAGMYAARGILTMHGGATSHAAVIARGMNKPAVVGLGQSLDQFPEGSIIALDGATGRVWRHEVPVTQPTATQLDALHARAYTALGAFPISSKATAPTQMIDVRGNYFLSQEEFDDKLWTELTAVTAAIILHEPKPEQLAVYDLMGITIEQRIAKFMGALSTMSHALLAKVRVLKYTHAEVHGMDVAEIPVINTASDLIMVSDDFVLGDQSTFLTAEAFLKVMEWKEQQGVKPMLVDNWMPGFKSYLSVGEALTRTLGS